MQGAIFECLVDHLGRLEPELPERLGRPTVSLIRLHFVLAAPRRSANPPTFSRGAAHSATTAGRPKERASAPSKPPLRPSCRPQTSALPRAPRPDQLNPDARPPGAKRRRGGRLPRGAPHGLGPVRRQRPVRAAHRPSPDRPGAGPRELRRRAMAAKPSACRTWAPWGRGRGIPAARASPSSSCSAVGEWPPSSAPGTGAGSARRRDDDVTVGVLSLGAGLDPGISLMASCTALRSAGLMGSSAFSWPEARTSLAICVLNRLSAAERRSR